MSEVPVTNISSKEEPIINKPIVDKESIILLLCSLFIGLLFDIMFIGKALGISYPIFIFVFYGIWCFVLSKHISFKFEFGWLLSIPIALLSFTYFMFSNTIFMFLNFITVPFLLVAQTIILTNSHKHDWFRFSFINDIIFGFLGRPFVFFDKPFEVVFEMFKRKSIGKKYATITKILIGLLISLPFIFVLAQLLSSADLVFNNLISKIPYLFKNIDLTNFMFRLILVLLIAIMFFSYIWSIIQKKQHNVNLISDSFCTPKGIFDSTITATILTSINILYFVFTAIQFTYLFGLINLGLPKQFTYAEYARHGFFELVIVTLINLSILLLNINFSKTEGKLMNIIQKILNSLLIVFTIILLISAHLRMSLYEEAYGYTYLRILTHSFMVFILILLIVTLVKVWESRVALFKSYVVLALIAYTIINYINIDKIVVNENIARYHKTGYMDIYTLGYLSYDSVPELVNLLNDKNKDIAQEIQNCLYYKKDSLKKNNYWQSFNLSKYSASNILSQYNLKYVKIEEIKSVR